MRRYCGWFPIAAMLALLASTKPLYTEAQDPEQYARDQYRGKTLLLRGFYSASRLHYDSSGQTDNTSSGDWTENGFVLVEKIHSSHDRLVIHARRLAVDFIEKQFQLRTLAEPDWNRKMKPAVLTIEADFPQHNPSPQQVDALVSRIFLNAHDQLADLVPDYWRPCVRRGLAGATRNVFFRRRSRLSRVW